LSSLPRRRASLFNLRRTANPSPRSSHSPSTCRIPTLVFMIEIPQKYIDRFWSKVDKDGPIPKHRPELGNCWIWLAGRSKLETGGYGVMRWPMDKSSKHAHRISWFIQHGEWPVPCALHRCDNPVCVRVKHLFEGTRADNVIDMCAKGRQNAPRGLDHPFRKKSHCPQGHEYTQENTLIMKHGARRCAICFRQQSITSVLKKFPYRIATYTPVA
jgi:hypothetical protein